MASTPPENLLKIALEKARKENASLHDRVSELEDTVRALKRSVFLLSTDPVGPMAVIPPPRIDIERPPADASRGAATVAGLGAGLAARAGAGADSGTLSASASASARETGPFASRMSSMDSNMSPVRSHVHTTPVSSASGGGLGPTFTPFIERVELKAHTASVYAVRFSRDGIFLASSSFDRSVVVWPMGNYVGATTKPHLSIADAHRAPAVAVEWTDPSAGRRLLTGGYDASAAEWDVDAGGTVPVGRYPTRGIVNAVSVCAGNPHIFFVGTARCAVHFFDRRAAPRGGSGASSAAPSQSFASLSLTAAARAPCDESTVIVENDASVNTVHVEYDGFRIITGDHGGVIKTWDLRMVTNRAAASSGAGVYKAKPASLIDTTFNDPQRKPITHVHSSPPGIGDDNGRCLAVNSYDNYLRVYDRGAFLFGKKSAALKPLHSLRGVVNRNWPIKSSFFVGSDYREPRDVARRQRLPRRQSGFLMSRTISGDQGSGSGGGTPNVSSGLISSLDPSVETEQGGKVVVVKPPAEGEESSDVSSHDESDDSFDSSSDEDEDEEVHRGGAQPRGKGAVYRPCQMPIQSAFILASGSADGKILLYDVGGPSGTGERVQVLRGHKDRVHAVEFHPTEPMLASCSADATVRLWSPGKSGL